MQLRHKQSFIAALKCYVTNQILTLGEHLFFKVLRVLFNLYTDSVNAQAELISLFRQFKKTYQAKDLYVHGEQTVYIDYLHTAWSHMRKIIPQPNENNYSLLKQTKAMLHEILVCEQERRTITTDLNYTVPSHLLKKNLIHYFGVPYQKIKVTPPTINTKIYKSPISNPTAVEARTVFRQKFKVDDHDLLLLHVGELSYRSGAHKTIELASYLRKHGLENLQILMIGEGSTVSILDFARLWGIEKKLHILNQTTAQPEHYWCADIFLLPSYYEPSGEPLLQAIACGLPALVSDAVGASEHVQQEDFVQVIDPFSPLSHFAESFFSFTRRPRWQDYWHQQTHLWLQNYNPQITTNI